MPPMKPSPMSLGAGIKPEPGDSAFSMCMASGPFTADTDLNYKPWHTLLESLETTKPAVLLLVSYLILSAFDTSLAQNKIGPFVDTAHPSIKNGDIDSTQPHLFRT